MIKLYIIFLQILCLSSFVYADSTIKSVKPIIYNEEALIVQLKGKPQEAVLKVLGNPTVKNPFKKYGGRLECWWYCLKEAGIFVYFANDKVFRVSVLTENRRSKKL